MTLVTLSSISKHFGSRDLFSGINLSIESGRRYALVGAMERVKVLLPGLSPVMKRAVTDQSNPRREPGFSMFLSIWNSRRKKV